MDEDRFNMELRKFLKEVGVTSQREIEKAIRDAADSGRLKSGTIKAKMVLTIDSIGLTHTVESDLNLT